MQVFEVGYQSSGILGHQCVHGMLILVLAVGVGAWALGRLQTNPTPGQGQQGGGFQGTGWGGNFGGSGPSPNGGGPNPNAHSSSQNSYAGPPPGTGPMPGSGPMPGAGSANSGPKSSWQQHGAPPPGTNRAEADPNTHSNENANANAQPNPNSHANGDSAGAAKGAWERAREETKRKQEERRAADAERKRKEEIEKKLREQREKEAREREAREREAEQRRQAAAREQAAREKEAAEKRQKEEAEKEAQRKEEAARVLRKQEEEALEKKRKEILLAAQRLKERTEREARERDIKEKRLRDEEARLNKLKEAEAREQKRKEDAAKKLEEESKPRGSMYAFSAVGEKTNPWPQGRPKTPPPPRPAPATPSPTKKPPPPTARTYRGNEDDAYSYRPYDKKPPRKNSFNSSYSQSSYAASQSTSRTTPPPSMRSRYTTKDPDKIVIKAVYAFSNAYQREPISKLLSGQAPVTDGLILRITTEGLFIDDDVRGVPQREWDVKAWTMKLVEVWCPSFRQGPAGISPSARAASSKHNPIRRLWGLDKDKPASPEETDALLVSMLSLCKTNCRLRASSSASDTSSFPDDVSDSAYGGSVRGDTDRGAYQTGRFDSKKLHVLRASLRDQDGKRYVFVISEEESWKIAVGLQRLRKGTQVRSLGVSGMSPTDAKTTLENLGW